MACGYIIGRQPVTEQALPARSHGLWLYYRAIARDRVGFAHEVAWLVAIL